jgi:probable phosphoglycerate mutase
MTEAMRSLEAAFLIGVEGATEIWLVRHGDCYEDMAEGPDPVLSATGRRQAERLAARVKALQPAAIFSSPARRALETARHIADDVRVDPRFAEVTLELGEQGEIIFTESAADVVARMTGAIDEIAAAHQGERVIVVGHAGAIVNYLTDVMRLEPGRLRILPYFTSVSIVSALGDRRMVGTLGDVSHLEKA